MQKCNMAHSYDRCRELLWQKTIKEQTREAAAIARELHALASEHELRETNNGASIHSIKKRPVPREYEPTKLRSSMSMLQ